MIRSPMLSVLVNRKRVFTMSCLVFLTVLGLDLDRSTSLAAYPQSRNSAAKGKEHYENAVAAISKSNWQEAKNELLRAGNLKPQNALVQFDLALAYSRTSQVIPAQTELNTTLQTVLRAESDQTARELKEQLASQTVEPKRSRASTEASESNEKQKPAQRAGLTEILDWLKDKLDTESDADVSITTSKGHYPQRSFYRIKNIDGCRITLVRTSESLLTNGSTYHESWNTPVNLSKLPSDVTVKQINVDISGERRLWRVSVPVQHREDQLPTTHVGDFGKSDFRIQATTEVIIDFSPSKKDIATRVGKALGDAIKICRGTSAKETY
jgi:hypothetical protein